MNDTDATGARFPIPPDMLSATYLGDYRIAFVFADGTCGVVDLEKRIGNGIFEPLKDISYFRRFRLNRDTRTIEWPNQADLAPSYLYERTLEARPLVPQTSISSPTTAKRSSTRLSAVRRKTPSRATAAKVLA
ncbi:MAG: DUF2442 domain-containing protein [Puniceicoccales bacterium]|jgi:hypothetical protein|nr:DUF2442 domain-containing protein [Puniceicoccales bacterium]